MVLEQQQGFLNQRWGGYDFLKILSINYVNLCFVLLSIMAVIYQ